MLLFLKISTSKLFLTTSNLILTAARLLFFLKSASLGIFNLVSDDGWNSVALDDHEVFAPDHDTPSLNPTSVSRKIGRGELDIWLSIDNFLESSHRNIHVVDNSKELGIRIVWVCKHV
jgi:hypothetical protein